MLTFLRLFSGDSSHYAKEPWDIGFSNDSDIARAKEAYKSVLTITASSSASSEKYQNFAENVKALSKER